MIDIAKAKPIIFSTPMVRAILDGRKTQTRRVIKIDDAPENWKISISGSSIVRTSPYDVRLSRYKVGDILYVRETWRRDIYQPERIYYKATSNDDPETHKWHPSIFMPKEAARAFLRVTNVRVERLQEITPKDAWEEGCRIGNSFPWEQHIPELQQQCRDIVFKNLWNNLNDNRGYGWDANPWVFVYKFEHLTFK